MKALITGVCGQDGAFLSKHLLDLGYTVYGVARKNAKLDNLAYVCGERLPIIIRADITDPFHMADIIRTYRPDELYNLAAQSHVGMSFSNPMTTCAVNYGGFLNILLAARTHAPSARIYQAGTSEQFGYGAKGLCNEDTPMQPKSPYAISKTAAYWAGVNARHEANQFVANGLCFNHESPIRGEDFVTRKITMGVAKWLKHGTQLGLGNIDSIRDWHHAKDAVRAMHLMLQQDKPDDFVIASGTSYSVREFIINAFDVVDKQIKFEGDGIAECGIVDGKIAVIISPEFYRPNDLTYLAGDATKAREVLGWFPTASVGQIVEEMVMADMRRIGL